MGKYSRSSTPTYQQRQRVMQAIRLKPVAVQGDKIRVATPGSMSWSSDLVGTDMWNRLEEKHIERQTQALAKVKTKQEVEKALSQVTPQQRFVILYELSLHRPLSREEYGEYKKLLKDNFPVAFKNVFGKD